MGQILCDFGWLISYASLLVVCWSGGGLVVWWLYSGVGDYPLVFVGIYLSLLLCVTVVIVAVCIIAAVRWWLFLFCLSNIGIGFKSLMMLYVLIMRRFRDFKFRKPAFCVFDLFGFLFWFVVSRVGFAVFVGVSQNVFSLSNWSVQGTFLYIWFTNSSIFPIGWSRLRKYCVGILRWCAVCDFLIIVCGWCWSTRERWYVL